MDLGDQADPVDLGDQADPEDRADPGRARNLVSPRQRDARTGEIAGPRAWELHPPAGRYTS
ncbi:hypothetical protein A5682_11270 [Mycobacterium mantenii]|nr:hypothetical protein A5687_10290 [Mycobacterium mantenii]OBH69282.1 hypothetical protein A5682_11270 [Mycobacterium mantenii]